MTDYSQLSLTAIVILIALLVLSFVGFSLLGRKVKQAPWRTKLSERYAAQNWQSMNDNEAVRVLDSLLEYGLKQRYNQDLGLGDLLKRYGKQLFKPDLDALWNAHKLRNKIIHEIDYQPQPAEISRAKQVLRRAIEQLIG